MYEQFINYVREMNKFTSVFCRKLELKKDIDLEEEGRLRDLFIAFKGSGLDTGD